MLQLKGKVAVITGASRGIGAATAKRLAQQGAAVLIQSEQIIAVDFDFSSGGNIQARQQSKQR